MSDIDWKTSKEDRPHPFVQDAQLRKDTAEALLWLAENCENIHITEDLIVVGKAGYVQTCSLNRQLGPRALYYTITALHKAMRG